MVACQQDKGVKRWRSDVVENISVTSCAWRANLAVTDGRRWWRGLELGAVRAGGHYLPSCLLPYHLPPAALLSAAPYRRRRRSGGGWRAAWLVSAVGIAPTNTGDLCSSLGGPLLLRFYLLPCAADIYRLLYLFRVRCCFATGGCLAARGCCGIAGRAGDQDELGAARRRLGGATS